MAKAVRLLRVFDFWILHAKSEWWHLAGNSLGGWLALELAKTGHARSVTALSPAGLWRRRTPTYNSSDSKLPPLPPQQFINH
jgi:pimeloyl-ACP methyl ester carboxylesterase